MKKLTCLILTAVLIITMAGCNEKETADNGQPTIGQNNTHETSSNNYNEEVTTEPENPLEPPEPPDPPDYIAIAKRLQNDSHGRIYIGMADLMNPNGYRYADEPGTIHPASTIKCMIMEYALLQIESGNAELSSIQDGYTLLYLIERMIQVSCNDSTGSLIARFGRENIDNWLQENYGDTRLYSDWRGYNHQNRYNQTSVEDTIVFLEKMWVNRTAQPYERMLDIMYGTTFSREKIPAATEGIPGVKVGNKTGSFVDGAGTADHDMAVVVKFGSDGEIEFAYALTFYSFSQHVESTYSVARPAIVAMARDIYEQVSSFHFSEE
ncbi:MAG: class A beta-lactamase-related serine hydrolase [Oscillospiraceae bacterium]|jgi:beta-lactamase class A|nr:class A beta-lactamase-related serine hydrolase [Oscillospiraceae bacterium]